MGIMKIKWIFLALLLSSFAACKSDEEPRVSGDGYSPEKKALENTPKEDEKVEIPEFKSSIKEVIDIREIDQDLLDYLVLNGINDVREEEGIKPLKISGVLIAAAKNQTLYQIKIDNLSHHQNKTNVRTAMDRVKYYGGDYKRVGENVQFQGFTIRSYNGKKEILTPSYETAAGEIVTGWVNSPGHYQNLINPDFTYAGTSVIYSPKKQALFATQVYGGF
jgi:uncharacterized protein YkwD